jgi:hypothetical protein
MSFNTAFPRQPLGISDPAKPPTDDPYLEVLSLNLNLNLNLLNYHFFRRIMIILKINHQAIIFKAKALPTLKAYPNILKCL